MVPLVTEWDKHSTTRVPAPKDMRETTVRVCGTENFIGNLTLGIYAIWPTLAALKLKTSDCVTCMKGLFFGKGNESFAVTVI